MGHRFSTHWCDFQFPSVTYVTWASLPRLSSSTLPLMKIAKSTSLTLSIVCILLFWTWAVLQSQVPPHDPQPLKIILMKLAYFCAIIFLLWINGESLQSIGFK